MIDAHRAGLLRAGCGPDPDKRQVATCRAEPRAPTGGPTADAIGQVLVDAGHDGGGWWAPQALFGPIDRDKDYQGKSFTELMRAR